jgi:hypothetical protein
VSSNLKHGEGPLGVPATPWVEDGFGDMTRLVMDVTSHCLQQLG